MKEINIHERYGKNLCSIRPFENIYQDHVYLASKILYLFSLTGGVLHVQVSRPTYEYEPNEMGRKIKIILKNNMNFDYKSDFFEFSFHCSDFNDELLNMLSKVWFAYEHVTYIFFADRKGGLDVKRMPWYVITSNAKSFVMFKGAEEDVVWIGKSKELTFDHLITS